MSASWGNQREAPRRPSHVTTECIPTRYQPDTRGGLLVQTVTHSQGWLTSPLVDTQHGTHIRFEDGHRIVCERVGEQVFEWHNLLLQALVPIPDVVPGDTVWWHCDMIHAVAPVEDQQGWGNVMYIPAAPWCDKNEAYTTKAYDAFVSGRSALDFPAEDYEVDWPNRFSPESLNEFGRRGFGLTA